MDTNLLLAGRTQYADPAPTDGEVVPLSMNRDGRVRVTSKPPTFTALVGALALVGDTLTIDVDDASNMIVHVKNTGTAAMAAGAFTFEGSVDSTDGVDGTWFAVQAVRTNANTIETATGTLSLAAGLGTAYAWELSVNAVRWFRIRCTTAVTASSVASWTAVPGSYATEPAPAIQSHGITGTVATTGTITGTVTTTGTITGTVATTTALVAAGGSSYNLTTAATTNAASIKTTAGTLAELSITNPTATAFYVKLYNKASAPTVGTDVPLLTIPVPANSFVNPNFGAIGKRFSTGIAVAVTAGIATADVAVAVAGGLISATYV